MLAWSVCACMGTAGQRLPHSEQSWPSPAVPESRKLNDALQRLHRDRHRADPAVVGELRFDASGDDRVVDVLADVRKASDSVIPNAVQVTRRATNGVLIRSVHPAVSEN